MSEQCNVPAQPGKWVVVNTHPHRENIAIDNLDRQRFTTYCPFVNKTIKHARRIQDVLRPLFPSYIFVRIDAERQRWRPILSTIGVRSLVSFGEQLSYLDDAFIQSLKTREVNGAIARPELPYQIGQKVCIARGPFDGLVATIISMTEKDRLVVLMDILNRPTKIKINADHCRSLH